MEFLAYSVQSRRELTYFTGRCQMAERYSEVLVDGVYQLRQTY
jgi:hypothetical protein